MQLHSFIHFGATTVYPDGVSWTYKVTEVSELEQQISLELVSTDSELSYSGEKANVNSDPSFILIERTCRSHRNVARASSDRCQKGVC